MTPIHNDNTKAFYWLVALAALLPRIIFILLAPENPANGDGMTYETVAENIIRGCGVSMSPVGSGECVPHFGGNQGPGYPAFIALIWWVSGHSDLAVRLAQGTICVASLVYLVHAVRCYTSSQKLALLTGLVLAISPPQIAWPRFIFTETLALAGTLWLFAELLKSLHESKLRVMPIGIALIAVTFIRLDAILLVIPVAVAGFIIHPPTEALRKGLTIALILGLPWGGWILRNMNVGLENIFRPPVLGYNESGKGYSSWGKTWSINQYQYTSMQWPISNRQYDTIRIDESAYYSESEKKRVKALLQELKDYTGKPFPKHIDNQFAILAKKRIETEPLKYYALNPIKRVWALWSNIYDSLGWPISLGGALSTQERLDIAKGDLESKLILLKKYPMQTLGKLFVNGWRVLLYILFLTAIIIAYKNKDFPYRDIVTLVISFVIARSIFSGLMNFVETRYTLTLIPIMEMATVMVFTQKWLQSNNDKII